MGKAYVIAGFRRDKGRSEPSIGVFVTPGPDSKNPDKRMLDKLGFVRVESVEEVKLEGAPSSEPTLYVFERTPAANSVLIAEVAKDGSLRDMVRRGGQPYSILPELSGPAVKRFINPRGVPSGQDLAKPPVQAENRMQKRRAFGG